VKYRCKSSRSMTELLFFRAAQQRVRERYVVGWNVEEQA
jgi:hypothetical protein